MDILILGAGRIGSVFAFHLSNAGHQVTVVARGERLQQLEADQAIVTADGRRAPVQARSEPNVDTAHDLVIVTVPEYQMEPLMPFIHGSAAKKILALFNTFRGPSFYQKVAVGRLMFGFPNMVAFLEQGRLKYKVLGPGLVTVVPECWLEALLTDAGLPAAMELNMEAYLKSHAAMVVPLFAAGRLILGQQQHLNWRQARALAMAWREGLSLVVSMGHKPRPGVLDILSRLPVWALSTLMWAFSRSEDVRNVGAFGATESHWLVDSMIQCSKRRMPHLEKILTLA